MTLTRVPPSAATARAGRQGRRIDAFRNVSNVVVFAFIVALLYPLYRMVSTIFWQNGHLSGSAFTQFARTPEIGSSVADTCIVVAASACVSVLVGGGMAYLNERTDLRWGGLFGVLPLVPFLMPPLPASIGWVLLLSKNAGYGNEILRGILSTVGVHLQAGPLNISSYPGLIFVYAIYQIPLAFMIISAGLRGAGTELEEQSRVCGAGRFRTLTHVVVPSVAPSVASAFLVVVWSGFSAYSAPSTIAPSAGIHIMSVQIVNFLNFSFPPAYGPALVLSLVVLALIGITWYAQSRIIRRARTSPVRGQRRAAAPVPLGAWKVPLRCLILLYSAAVALLPTGALLLVVLNGYWTPHIEWSALSFAPFQQAVFGDAQSRLAIQDSLGLGVAIATAGMVIAAVVSVRVATSGSRLARVSDGTLKLPVTLSHLVLAIGFVLAFAGPPFHLGGTWMILFVAYLVLYMPQGTLISDAATRQVGSELVEASRISGARSWRTFRKVYLPMISQSLAVGWALLFVWVLGDLEVSEIVSGTSNPTIGSQTLALYNSGTYAGVAALALVLIVLTTVVVVLVLGLTRRRARWMGSDMVISGVGGADPK